MGARTDVRFLLFPAVCEWFTTFSQLPMCLAASFPHFIILNGFSAGEVAPYLAVFVIHFPTIKVNRAAQHP